MKNFPVLSIFLISTLTLAGQGANDKCIIKSEFIFQPGDVPFPSCHASTIVQNGKALVAAWFGGTRERNPDVCIWESRYEKGSWTKPEIIADGIQYKGKRYPCWNPVLTRWCKSLLLFYKVGPSPSEWWGELKRSFDGGRSWSEAIRLPEGIVGPVKDKPLLLDNGYMLCPSSTEDKGWSLHMEFTHDGGLTWERTGDLEDSAHIEVIQPTTLIHNDRIQLLCRSKSGWIMSSWSNDYGRTWDALAQTILPNPNSGIDAVSLKDGRFLVVYNHLTKGRNMLNAAISADGKSWQAAFLIENDEKGKEFSYPAVIQTDDGMIHITYTWNRTQIRHIVVDPALIHPIPFNNGEWPGIN